LQHVQLRSDCHDAELPLCLSNLIHALRRLFPSLTRYQSVPIAIAVFLSLVVCAVGEAQTSAYTFTRIADTNQFPGIAGARCVGVNNLGTVIFTTSDGSVFIREGATGAFMHITGPDSSGQPILSPCPGLNDFDDIVYGFTFSSPAHNALLMDAAGTVTELASSDKPPFLNETGETSIHSLTNSRSTLMKGIDGKLYVMPSATRVYSQAPTDPVLSTVLAGTMNESNIAAFYAVRQDASGSQRAGIYRGSATPLVEDGNAMVDFVRSAQPAINNTGVIAFLGSRYDGLDHVLTTSDGISFIDHSARISTNLSPVLAINDNGTVVFGAILPGDTGFGLFTGPDSVRDKVIAPGDSLDGSTVVTVSIWQEALNANGQISFVAQLADGRWGVYRADPNSLLITTSGTRKVLQNTPLNQAVATSNVNQAPIAISVGSLPAAVRFDASTDELVRTTNLPPVTSFTMMGWFRLASDSQSYMAFLGLGHPTSSNAYLLMMCCGNGWRQLMVWTGAQFVQGPTLALNTWYHLALTVAGSGPGQVKAYLNGVLVMTLDGNPAVTADRFSIGNDSHHDWFDGSAAAIKVYDTVLTAAEIAAEMAVVTPVRTAGLNGWYPLQSAATAASDGSGNGQTLTVSGRLATDAAGPPLPVFTPLVTLQNTPISGIVQASDPDGDPLVFSLDSAPSFGTAVVNANGNFTYKPAVGFVGSDSFVFAVSDGIASATATVYTDVTP
jgi:concanavalin A-like lectin/glucanase superfamily protein/Big-like domain-containing protein